MAFNRFLKHHPCIKNYSLIAAAIALFSIGGTVAHAHKVSVFAWIAEDTVHVESKFGGGRKPKGAPVVVYDDRGRLLLKGRTNASGEFSFKLPQKTEMKIILLAGPGHKAEWHITEADLSEASADQIQMTETSNSDPQQPDSATHFQPGGREPEPGKPSDSREEATAEEIQIVVEKALDRKLKPIMKMLVDSREKGPGITDVLGGIGYIFGLIGVAAYFHYRKKATDKS